MASVPCLVGKPFALLHPAQTFDLRDSIAVMVEPREHRTDIREGGLRGGKLLRRGRQGKERNTRIE
jgi:hypothetical protein